MRTSIVLMGCSQPSRLAPERAPMVETAADISFNNPIAFDLGIHQSIQWSDAIHRPMLWTKAMRAWKEICFPDGLQQHLQEHLNNTVLDGRDPQRTPLPTWFRDVLPTDGRGLEAAGLQFRTHSGDEPLLGLVGGQLPLG